MKNILKKEQGITLIALVTAIIILLILSGITIGMLSSENGLINQSYQSSQDAQKESIIEKIEADLYSEKTITGKIPNESKLIEIAEKYGTVDKNNKSINLIDNGAVINFSDLTGWDGVLSATNEFKLDKIICDGTNYINTGINLYSEENINKDFEISFEVIHIGNITDGEIILSDINSSDDSMQYLKFFTKSGWYMISTKKTNYNNLICASKLNENNQREFIKYKITIKREYNEIIYQIDNGNETFFSNISSSGCFDSPLTFGASLDENGNPQNFFKGEITNINVKLADKPSYTEIKTANSYKLEGNFKFKGNNYLDTGLSLFSEANINRNFEIDFDINELYSNIDQATIINSMDEKSSPWPGFVVRYSGENDIIFKANSTASYKVQNSYNKNSINKVKIKRIGKKLYYSINNGTENELIDYTNIARTFNSTLTIGSSIDGSGNSQRFFKGILSNIYARFTN